MLVTYALVTILSSIGSHLGIAGSRSIANCRLGLVFSQQVRVQQKLRMTSVLAIRARELELLGIIELKS